MPLIVPAGATFSIGSNAQTSGTSMSMSLDDVIAKRRKDTMTATRRGGRTRVSTADRTVAGGRAKRTAAVNARRNMTPTKKPTKMEIEKEVKTQSARTQRTKANQDKKKAGGRVAATGGRTRRADARAAGRTAKQPAQQTRVKQAAVQLVQGKPPSKKAVNAAVQAFKANGFNIPQGTQMVIRFEGPAASTNNNNNNNSPRNAARAAGRAKATGNNNNNNNNNRNNNNSNRNNNNNNNGGNSNNNGNNGRRGRNSGGRGRN